MASKLFYGILTSFLLPCFISWFILKIIPWWKNPSLPVLVDGFVAEGFENIREIFRTNIEEMCNGGGAGFSVYHKGKLIVNLWGGYADSETLRPWKKDTLAVFFSSTKGVAAMCVAILVERGLLDYDALVTKYWPEFGQNGKENVTVRMLLSHQAGLAALERPIELNDFHNPAVMKKLLEQAKPLWPPGTGTGYHIYTFGQYVSQLIQQVDAKHRTVGQFFEEEFAHPLEIDFHIGLPRQEYHRMAQFWEPEETIVKFFEKVININSWSYLACAMSQNPMLKKAMTSVNLQMKSLANPEWLEIEMAGANGVGTAQALAKFYGLIMNQNKIEGRPLLSKNIISTLLSPLTSRKDVLLCMNMTMGHGFIYFKDPHKGQTQIFGHPGYGGQYAGGDFQQKLGFAFLSNVISSDVQGQDPRFISLLTAIYQNLENLDQTNK